MNKEEAFEILNAIFLKIEGLKFLLYVPNFHSFHAAQLVVGIL